MLVLETRVVQDVMLTGTRYLSPAALDLAELLLAYDPSKRATAAQALLAPYFVSEDPPAEKPVG